MEQDNVAGSDDVRMVGSRLGYFDLRYQFVLDHGCRVASLAFHRNATSGNQRN
jgi:hypothetical protein